MQIHFNYMKSSILVETQKRRIDSLHDAITAQSEKNKV